MPDRESRGSPLEVGNARLGVSRDIGQLVAGELAHAVARDLEHMARRARRDRRQRNAPLPDLRNAVADNETAFAVKAKEQLVAADGVAGEMDRFAASKRERVLSGRQAATAQALVQGLAVRRRRVAKGRIVDEIDQLHDRHNTAESSGWYAARDKTIATGRTLRLASRIFLHQGRHLIERPHALPGDVLVGDLDVPGGLHEDDELDDAGRIRARRARAGIGRAAAFAP